MSSVSLQACCSGLCGVVSRSGANLCFSPHPGTLSGLRADLAPASSPGPK